MNRHEPTLDSSAAPASGATVVFVGLGNIGSPAAGHVGREKDVARAVLIDPDDYEEKNLFSQEIVRSDVGKSKVAVSRRRLRAVNPRIQVHAIRARVERVPLAFLRASCVVAGLDGLASRMWLAEACWHLNVPLFDGGVEPSGALARLSVYLPGPGRPCMQCAFDESHYARLAQRVPCQPDEANAATNAPPSLGGLVAALQSLELRKLLAGASDQLLDGREVVVDTAWHRQFVTRFQSRPSCRFDHAVWQIETLDAAPAALSAQDLLGVVRPPSGSALLRVPGTELVRFLTCRACSQRRSCFRLANRLRASDQYCRACGGRLLVAGADVQGRFAENDLPPARRRRPLSALGLEPGDIVAVGAGESQRHLQLGRPAGTPGAE